MAMSVMLVAGLASAAGPAHARRHEGVHISQVQPSLGSHIPAVPPIQGVSQGRHDLVQSVMRDVMEPSTAPERSKEEIAAQLEALYKQYVPADSKITMQEFMHPVEQDVAQGAPQRMFEDSESLLPNEYLPQVQKPATTLPADLDGLMSLDTEQDQKVLSYPQFWSLVDEGMVEQVMFYGHKNCFLMARLSSSVPGGADTVYVNVPEDPMLLDHLTANGVAIDTDSNEAERLNAVFAVQVSRYALPFFIISALFWLLHTAVLDPAPNAFKRQEYIRHRRETLYITAKLNFRSPVREVRIDMKAPDFIAWDDINGIDAVKREIEEIIEYLKNPALQKQQGVARIGGILLAGAPGTGKTLLAKSIAAESGVRMFTCSGTDFVDVYSGVGARRIRETFDKMRKNGPAILFVDEFDALGAARGTAASGDESASIINELLVQMDGFEDNNGVIVLGATNRPGAIDSALIRPGRFDRIIYMPLPDAAGRAKILQVHARDKRVDPNLNWNEVARAMSGFTGADCMGLMMRAAGMAGRQGRDRIQEEDLYAAMENKAMESFSEMTGAPRPGQDTGVPNPISHTLRKRIAVYEAGKVITAYITPEFEEIARVSICPNDLLTGYTLFLEDEGKTLDSVVTRGDLESHMVVNLGGTCAERLVMGEGGISSLGATDAFQASMIAREMIMSMGMGRRMGPMDLMFVTRTAESTDSVMGGDDVTAPEPEYNYHATDMSTEQGRIAMSEVSELLEAAEAKAYYGIAINWKPLQALSQALLDRGVLQGKEVARILEANGVVHFNEPHIEGFGWDKKDGTLVYPLKPARVLSTVPEAEPIAPKPPAPVLTGVKAKTWFAGTPLDAPRDENGNFKHGWHWNMPYTVQRE